MSETLIQILAGAGLFGLGIVIGALFQRSFQGDADKSKRLEQKLAEAQDHHEHYQAEVSAHFMETANLVRTMNKSYRDVHAQLVKGASRLCDNDQADEFLGISFDTAPSKKRSTYKATEEIAPPMDYAPKHGSEEEGMLSESYGLKKSDKDSDEEDDSDAVPPPRI